MSRLFIAAFGVASLVGVEALLGVDPLGMVISSVGYFGGFVAAEVTR